MAKERESKTDSVMISFRVSSELVRKAEEIQAKLAGDAEDELAPRASLSSIYRVALTRGLESLAAEVPKPRRRRPGGR